jgi:hypothetical protein
MQPMATSASAAILKIWLLLLMECSWSDKGMIASGGEAQSGGSRSG